MDLVQRFGLARCERSIRMAELKINKSYTIVKAQRSNTKFGPTILISIKDDSDRSVRGFLPKRYTSLFNYINIQIYNDGEIKLNMIYHGR